MKSMMVIEIPVADTRRAIEFYVGQLGFYIDLKKNPPSIWDTETEFFIFPANGIPTCCRKLTEASDSVSRFMESQSLF